MEGNIKPEKITKPIQVVAAWLAALGILVATFLTAAVKINIQWLQSLFGITAVAIVPIFIGLVFLMQTKFRVHTLDDPYYSEYLKRQEEIFKNFRPENINGEKTEKVEFREDVLSLQSDSTETNKDLEKTRKSKYQQNYGLFLVHTSRPSQIPDQVADIAINLAQHCNGPLKEGKIKSVEYCLGPKFFKKPVLKKNTKDDFRLDVSAYGPMLCLARVNFSDGRPSILLERYINF